jgi:NADH dehydrogenase (ubiquinone) Fe-S protein 2
MASTKQIKNVILNLGPQSTPSHGVLRSVLEMDGEVVERVEPHIGLLRHGKIIKPTYLRASPSSDRLDYVSIMAHQMLIL